MSSERRLRKRIDLLIHLLAINAQTGLELGRVVDANLSGLLLLSPAPLPTDEVFAINIQVPPPHDTQPFVYCKAKVVRSELAENEDFHLIALEIEYMRLEDTKLFEKIILALEM